MKPFKLLAIAVALMASLAVVYVTYSAIGTLGQLDAVERARDGWQHPDQIIAALDLRAGQRVVDLGSGAGYFTLKLSPMVGSAGRVVAIDLRKLSLAFLWTRAHLRGLHNIQNVIADPGNPHLPAGADAILICNTYHEFRDPTEILQQAYRSLKPGGRLVIADRGPARGTPGEHAVSSALVLTAVKQAEFTIKRTTDPLFIDLEREPWWLLVARKQ